MNTRNFDQLRQDFPILSRKVNDKPLVYLDNAASSQKPRQVIEAMNDLYFNHYANVHRGAHTLSVEATELYEAVRAKVARFLHAPSTDSVIFTRNATEALNLFAQSWGHANLQAGDEIIVSVAEHHANLVPWHLLRERIGIHIKAIELTPNHRLDLDHFQALLSSKTRLVCVAQMSNVLGSIHPVSHIAEQTHRVGALMVVDGAQATPHMKVDVQALGADVYAFSGHKMCGPSGAGALWVKEAILEKMPPFLGGGDMIRKVFIDHSTYADIPSRFEAGTPAIAEVVGLGAAIDYLEAIGMDRVLAHDQQLVNYALAKLEGIPGITLYGPKGSDRGGIIPFNIDGVHAHDVATALDLEGIAVRAGHHCAQPLMRKLDVPATARASFYFYNTETEVDRFVQALVGIQSYFASFS